MEVTTLDTQVPVALSEHAFGAEFRGALVHQAVVACAARARAGSSQQKSRGMVRGGGAKPWRQKGTGRARAGSNRSPLWRGGGVAHPAVSRSYRVKMNKKMYRQALRSIFSELLRGARLHVVEQFELAAPKTRLAREKLDGFGLSRVLILVEKMEANLYLAVRNLVGHDACEVDAATPLSLLRYDHVMLTRGALEQLERRLGEAA